VGPQWNVDDGLAGLYSRTFFAALEGGATFGQAARTARLQVREQEPGNPSWLAYTIYAHPNGRLYLGSRLQAASADALSELRPPVLDTGKLVAPRRRRRSPRRLLVGFTIAGLAFLAVLAVGLYGRLGGDTKTDTSTPPPPDLAASAPAEGVAVTPSTIDIHALQRPPYRQDAVRFYVVAPGTVDPYRWRDRIERTADSALAAVDLVRTRSTNAAWLAVLEVSEPTLSQGATGQICNVRASFEIYHERQQKGEVETMAGKASQFTEGAACEAAIHKVAERVSQRVVTAYQNQTSEE
jgi:hypothetical protein